MFGVCFPKPLLHVTACSPGDAEHLPAHRKQGINSFFFALFLCTAFAFSY